MLKRYSRRIGLGIAMLAILLMITAGILFKANAAPTPGISSLSVSQFDCSSFNFQGGVSPFGGYAAVRIWIDHVGGTPIVDSFVPGFPSAYFPVQTTNGAILPQIVTFPAPPDGTTLVARVYRSLSAGPNSWDHQNYVDTTTNCNYGISQMVSNLTCSHWPFTGMASPGTGYAGVRIWLNNANGTRLVDSYSSGFPSYYAPIAADGSFHGDVNFPPQPVGTTFLLRLYRTTSTAPSSWDHGDFKEITETCQPLIATVTPFP